jgi:hypothetical protein
VPPAGCDPGLDRAGWQPAFPRDRVDLQVSQVVQDHDLALWQRQVLQRCAERGVPQVLATLGRLGLAQRGRPQRGGRAPAVPSARVDGNPQRYRAHPGFRYVIAVQAGPPGQGTGVGLLRYVLRLVP